MVGCWLFVFVCFVGLFLGLFVCFFLGGGGCLLASFFLSFLFFFFFLGGGGGHRPFAFLACSPAFFSITFFNLSHDPKSECSYLYSG